MGTVGYQRSGLFDIIYLRSANSHVSDNKVCHYKEKQLVLPLWHCLCAAKSTLSLVIYVRKHQSSFQ